MELNVRELLSGENQRLRFIGRFSTCHVSHRESVAEHSFFVNLFSVLVARWCQTNDTGMVIDYQKLMQGATFHDLEEARTGDFFRPFKYSTEELRRALTNAGELAARQTVTGLVNDEDQEDTLVSWWVNAKDSSREGCIVAFCDFLSVLSYMVQEVAVSNLSMREHRTSMLTYAHIFDIPQFDFLAPLVEQARALAIEVLT